MDHLAILDKKKPWLQKILAGEKTIESRWYRSRRAPWKQIQKGDTIYFKNSGEAVTATAQVDDLIFIDHPTEKEIKSLLQQYAEKICIPGEYRKEYQKYNYITLLFLKNPQEIEPFSINKSGYGSMAAWISLEDIKQIKSTR